MFTLSNIGPKPGAVKKKKRRGRGDKTAGRGTKGQKARSGGAKPRWFEGGQMPLYRRLPKKGFKNPFARVYEVVNLADLARFEAGTEVTPELLRKARLVRRKLPVKILARGEITKALTVKAHAFSAKAKEKIEAAGGQAIVIEAGESSS